MFIHTESSIEFWAKKYYMAIEPPYSPDLRPKGTSFWDNS